MNSVFIVTSQIMCINQKLKAFLKVMLYVCLSAACLVVLIGVGLWACTRAWVKWEYRLPTQQHVYEQFESHKSDYIRFSLLLRSDPTARYIGNDGRVDIDGVNSRLVPEYRDLVHKLGVKFVDVADDGSIEFVLGGFGAAIADDSYMGVLYFPKDKRMASSSGFTPTVVSSLSSAALPQENGAVATGFYVVPIEPEWFIYRDEYRE